MKIECRIQNKASTTFPCTSFKKIRQIIFINRNTIDIYTALLVGANKTGIQDISLLNEGFSLEVDFNVIDEENGSFEVKSTNCMEQFDKELQVVSALWGECICLTSQNEVIEAYKQVVSNTLEEEKLIPGMNTFYKIGGIGASSSAIVCSAAFNAENNKNKYRITGNANMHKGVDLISWVKTTISLGKKVRLDEQIEYIIDFLPKDQNYKTYMDYVSIYFCSPEGYHISEDSTEVNWHRNVSEENRDKKNNVNKASHNAKYYYKEWIDQLDILNRNIYRLNQEKVISEFTPPYYCTEIDFKFSLCTNTEKGSIQFVLGAVFSALMTYGVDMGRLQGMDKSFWPVVPADVQWYFVCIFLFIIVLRWTAKKRTAIDSKKVMPEVFFCIGVVIEILWFLLSYVIFRFDLLQDLLNKLPRYLLPGLYASGIVFLVIYQILTYTLYKKQYIKRHVRRDMIF